MNVFLKLDLTDKIVIWDNDGTIVGSKDPNDKTSKAKVILPGIRETMRITKFNCVISGFKSPESEAQDFDPNIIIEKFTKLMEELPIQAVAFSPKIGGITCYVVVKNKEELNVIEAHNNPKYKSFIGKFKKPETGMFHVMQDVVLEHFNIKMGNKNTIMIGDTWHDKVAAETFGIQFLNAELIHSSFNSENIIIQQENLNTKFIEKDFSNIDINDAKFENCEFENCNFDNSKLIDCEFNNCSFKKISMQKCEFAGTIINNCNFSTCNLSNIDFSSSNINAKMFNIKFIDCKMVGANFLKLKSSKVEFKNCLLRMVYFFGFNLKKQVLDGLDFTEADICDCNFEEAVFEENCSFRKVNFKGSNNFKNADLRGCDIGNVSPDKIQGAFISKSQATELLSKLDIKVI
ncbi:MAG: pentapeptide repeat-containing protein [Rickettsiales bacterium]|nr:pentapeptide repeat-containing protein [Rickettsiales bacterium]